MKYAKQHVVTILIACTSLGFMSEASFAAPAKPAVQITNETGRKITYEFKWDGYSKWEANVIRPGYEDTHSRPYDPKGVLPAHIRFIPAAGIEGGEYKSYKLDWGPPSRPGRYHFEVRNNKVVLVKD